MHLAEIAPGIRSEIRYAGADNFTGARVPGYDAAECLLRRSVAEALARVAQDLAAHDPPLALIVYDCYRPVRAVAAFVAFARDASAGDKSYFPRLAKRDLLRGGYIAARSGHSRGIAVDLTLALASNLGTAKPTPPSAPPAPCTAEKRARTSDHGVDMGTGFDCFDERSHAGHGDLTAEQTRWRRVLAAAMARRGFEGYAREWWHFSYPAADDGRSFDVPVGPR
ncbi:MAG: M15 family metallopeptidase [Pseudomonadota bacterium]